MIIFGTIDNAQLLFDKQMDNLKIVRWLALKERCEKYKLAVPNHKGAK